MSKCCLHVHVTGEEKVIDEIGRALNSRSLSVTATIGTSSLGVTVIGQNIYVDGETDVLALAGIERLAKRYPEVRIVHLYQNLNDRVRGIAIYEGGRRTSFRQVAGAAFRLNDWLSFPDFGDWD